MFLKNAESVGHAQCRLRSIVSVGAALILLCGPVRAEVLVLESRLTSHAPQLDGSFDDTAWRDAKPIMVPVHQPTTDERKGDTVVELRSVRTVDEIFWAIRWHDPTNSIDKEKWTFDGQQWSQHPDVDEDRFSLIFPIDHSVPWFASSGCTLTCHARQSQSLGIDSTPRWYKGTLAESERIDAWHWKSVRTNPIGYVDDKYWIYHPPNHQRKNAGRYYDPRDAGPSPAARNAASGGKHPAYMQDPNQRPRSPGFLFRDQAVRFDPSGFKAGDTLPGRVLSKPSGSQYDIRCVGIHRDGYWHLEMRRALNTGHKEDVVFRPGDKIPFGLAVFENVSERRKQDHGKATDLLWLSLPRE